MVSRFTPTDTSRYLLLGRHGEKDNIAGLPDIEQPLTRTGISQWKMNGNNLIMAGIKPDYILSSSVGRALNSAKHLLASMDIGYTDSPAIQQCGNTLYSTYEASDLVSFLQEELPDTALCPLIIGHNPGMHRLALHLAGANETPLRAQIDVNFPSAALCLFQVQAASWTDLTPKTCTLIGLLSESKMRLPVFPGPRP